MPSSFLLSISLARNNSRDEVAPAARLGTAFPRSRSVAAIQGCNISRFSKSFSGVSNKIKFVFKYPTLLYSFQASMTLDDAAKYSESAIYILITSFYHSPIAKKFVDTYLMKTLNI